MHLPVLPVLLPFFAAVFILFWVKKASFGVFTGAAVQVGRQCQH